MLAVYVLLWAGTIPIFVLFIPQAFVTSPVVFGIGGLFAIPGASIRVSLLTGIVSLLGSTAVSYLFYLSLQNL